MLSTVLSVALGFILGALFLAVLAWIAFSFFGFRIIKDPDGAIIPMTPHTRPTPPALSTVVPGSAPPRSANAPLSRLRVELYIENAPGKTPKEIPVPLVFSQRAPEEGLRMAPRTIMAGDLSPHVDGIDIPEGLPPFSRELIESLQPGGCLLIGREGHVGVGLGGFEIMSRVLCEVVVVGGRFHLSAKKGMRDFPVQVKMGKRDPVIMTAATASIMITDGVEIRQVMPRAQGKPPQVSLWYFKLILC